MVVFIMKERILKLVASFGWITAMLAGDTASWLTVYQPKEPEEVKHLKNVKNQNSR